MRLAGWAVRERRSTVLRGTQDLALQSWQRLDVASCKVVMTHWTLFSRRTSPQRVWIKALRPFGSFWKRWISIALLSLMLVVSGQSIAIAQISLDSGQDPLVPPAGVQRIGLIEVASVTLERRHLFKVVSSTVRDRSNPGDAIPVEARVAAIEANLQRVLAFDPDKTALLAKRVNVSEEETFLTEFDPQTLRVTIAVLNGETILQVQDNYRRRPLDLMTVTELDAEYHGLSVNELAQRWQLQVFEVLKQELQARTPETLARELLESVLLLLFCALLSTALWLLQRKLFQRRKRILADLSSEADSLSATTRKSLETNDRSRLSEMRWRFLATLQEHFSMRRRQKINSALRWLLRWVQAGIWLFLVLFTMAQFPGTQRVLSLAREFLVVIVLALFGAGLADRITDSFIERAITAWSNNQFSFLGFEVAQRQSLRATTYVTALKGLTTFVFYAIAIVTALWVLEIPTNPILAGGAVVGIAISFGSQNIVRDVITGLLILLEDQYGVGDVIAIGSSIGLVEHMNLRITQIRNGEGRLITIPNGSIGQVENLTRSWSRVDFTIEVAYEADIEHALDVIRSVGQDLYAEPNWAERMLEPPELLGIDGISHCGILIRVWIKTRPLEQWSVGREYRLRICLALEKNNIPIGKPQQVFYNQIPENSKNGHHKATAFPAPQSESS